MKKHLKNIFRLGIKEFQTLWHDKVMVILIIYVFSLSIYIDATSASVEIHNASIAFVDEDRSALSVRVIDAFYPPRFKMAGVMSQDKADLGMDVGEYTFIVVIPSGFEKDILSDKQPDLQLNIDATRMTQAGVGAGYIQQIIVKELTTFTTIFHCAPNKSHYKNEIQSQSGKYLVWEYYGNYQLYFDVIHYACRLSTHQRAGTWYIGTSYGTSHLCN